MSGEKCFLQRLAATLLQKEGIQSGLQSITGCFTENLSTDYFYNTNNMLGLLISANSTMTAG